MSFPPSPVNTINWDDIGFKVREGTCISSPRHLALYHTNITNTQSSQRPHRMPLQQQNWPMDDPQIRYRPLPPHPWNAPALNYGQQAYEGMKAFRTPSNELTIFRANRNAARLQHSASFISIPPVPENIFLEAVHAAVSLNAEFVPPHETGAAMYIRPLIFGSCAQLGLSPPEEYMFCVYVLPVGVYHGVHPVKALILEEFDRSAPDGTGSAKVGGNYAPVLRWSDKARNEGYGITLHLDSKTRTEIDEFSTSGFIGVKTQGEETTLVVPDSKCVIASVTSDSCLEIAKSKGWKVEKRSIKYEELPEFSEVLAAGTAAALVPIKSITRTSCNQTTSYIKDDSEEPGPVCMELLRVLQGIQQGKLEDTFGWTSKVSQVDAQKYSAGEQTNGVNGDSIDKLP
ncbi:putative branched-chain-amino-acid aminotransferase [Lachnellula occidentalis]|uniref:Putative branched-chain-amino-acid aminotransferase n=1 Tax=Lachnellula occidentalis TaxID=215460 RepID=A0A8H8UEQ7_9HELO|nr:putative branched-chain-amino-acid aminotransferase [Lachnellula occidentalis]